MKRIYQLFAVAVITIASACSSGRQSASVTDDVYYSKGDAQQSPPAAISHPAPSNRISSENSGSNQDQENQAQDNSTNYSSEQSTDQNGNTIINNYYNDDYYDYSYSSRLKRYYSPLRGYAFYDPYYTNMYWYDYNPSSWGVSIYLGYHFWAPSYCYYQPFVFSPFGYGWGYSPFYSPYSIYGYYGGYSGGYHNPYYYNSYDGASSHYYGPRGSLSGTGRSTSSQPRTIGEKYQQAVAENRVPVLKNDNVRNSGSSAPGQPTRTEIGDRNNVKDHGDVNTGIPTRNSAIEGSKENGSDPAVAPTRLNTNKGIISDKNENGGTRVIQDASTPKNVLGQESTPKLNNTRPKGNSIQGSPDNGGGNVPSKFDREPSMNQIQPQNSQSGNEPIAVPRNNDSKRDQNATPRNFDLPKKDRNYDRPRQYQQAEPKIEQRQEQRQYKQESPQPRQERSYSQPSQKSNSAPSENRGSGRRK